MAEQPSLSFAGLLRQLRAEAKLTQEELADAAGLSPRSVSDLERGINRTARKDTALLLAGPLGLTGPASELFVAAARGRALAAEALAAARGAWAPQRGAAGSPYRGLSAFEEQDAPFFFGREAATATLVERMSRLAEDTGLLVVSGVSGTGKTSLLRAGVLPQIRRSGLAGAPEAASWPTLVFTPTCAPLDELALRVGLLAGADAAAVRRGLQADPAGFALTVRQAALAQPGEPAVASEVFTAGQRRLLLVVDQFEELFTLCPDEGQRRAFAAALHTAASAGQGSDQASVALVVLGVRADFEAQCVDYPQLAGVVRDRYAVMPMTERQLRMAITEPAKKAGSWVDADLVEVLLAEARSGARGGSGAGVLPFLSHALGQAWQCRTEQSLTLTAYERAGGIEGAVASSAERGYGRLSPAQQAEVRQVFMRLATISGDDADTVDTVTRAELTTGKSAVQTRDIAEILEVFAGERLLTLAADGVAISHEAVLTAWPLLRDTWLADNRADRIVRTRLRHTAAEWARRARDPSYLYRGSLLMEAIAIAARIGAAPTRYPPLSQTEHDFLSSSDRARRRRAHQRLALAGVLAAVIIATGAVVVLAVRYIQAAHQQAVALSQAEIIRSRTLDISNPVLAEVLSLEAWRLDPSRSAQLAMLAAASGHEIATLPHRTEPVTFSPNGKLLASDDQAGKIWLWNTTDGRSAQEPFPSDTGQVISMAFNPTGNTMASGNSLGTVQLWRVATASHTLVGVLTGHHGPVPSVAFSPHGELLATGANDGTVQLWRVTPTSHTLVGVLTGHHGPVLSVAFSPNAELLAAGTNDGTVQLWRVATASHTLVGVLTGPTGSVSSVAFSPDGSTLATGSADNTVRLWDITASGLAERSLARLSGPQLAEHLCATARQPAIRAQWTQYMQDQPDRRPCS